MLMVTPFLSGHSWVHFVYRLQCTVYLEFKLRYLKNLKLFLIGVKELLEAIVLKKTRRWFLLFSKAFSSEPDLSVTVGDFYGKDAKFGKGNLYLTENRLSGNKKWCAADNHNHVSHICKRILRFEL